MDFTVYPGGRASNEMPLLCLLQQDTLKLTEQAEQVGGEQRAGRFELEFSFS